MRDILFLAHRLPFPPDRGDRIRSWHVVQALAKLARVHVIAPVDSEGDLRFVAEVERVAASVFAVARNASYPRAMARALIHNTPASVEAFVDPRISAAVSDCLSKHDIGTIYAFSGQMAYYVPKLLNNKKFIMDFVDMDSAKFAAQGWAHRQEGKRLLNWEIAAAKRADLSLFVSKAEADLFTSSTNLPAQILENGIDLDRFKPGICAPEPTAPHPLIVFTGQMDYGPNIAAVTHFASQSLPRIRAAVPGATFAIVGRAPTSAVRALVSESVIVTGEVPDTRPWLAAADVVVAPLNIARGVQNKVLEAMAMGCAVIVSPSAAEGIDAVVGRDLLVAGDPIEDCIALLTTQRGDVQTAARARMEARYGWDAVMVPLADMLAA